MILTATDIIVDALGVIGATQMDQTPPAWEIKRALRALNEMINFWSAQKLMVRGTFSETLTLTSGKADYTVGTAGDWNTIKPISITNVYITDTSGNDFPISIIPKAQYDSLDDKGSSGRPYYIFYDSGLTQGSSGATWVDTGSNSWDDSLVSSWASSLTSLGELYTYPTPDTSYTLKMQTQKPFLEFANASDPVTFEPHYQKALKYNLAIELWSFYRKPTDIIPPHITFLANDTLRVIKAINSVQVKARIDVPSATTGSRYNIYSDK